MKPLVRGKFKKLLRKHAADRQHNVNAVRSIGMDLLGSLDFDQVSLECSLATRSRKRKLDELLELILYDRGSVDC